MKKLITIDLWLTLIESNPDYKQAQVKIISDYIQTHFDITVEDGDIMAALRGISKNFDRVSETHSLHVRNTTRLYYIIRKIMLDYNIPIAEVLPAMDKLHADIDQCMINVPPLLLDPNVKTHLNRLIELGFELSVASNTGLQNGVVMRQVLEKLDIKECFKHFLFSDETVYAKPSLGMFRDVLQDPELKGWYHIGDNNVADDIGYADEEEDPWYHCIIPINYSSIDFKDFGTIVNIIESHSGVVSSVSVIDIEDQETTTLDPLEYSRFKHGSKEICEKYAEQLSSSIVYQLDKYPKVKNILIYGAPYNNVPAASNFLVFDMIRELRRLVPTLNIQEGKIKRKNSYHGDYGLMSKEERRAVLKDEEFEFVTEYRDCDLAIFVDDIYITGSHEELILQLLRDERFEIPFFMAYYAKLNPGCCEPQYESQLNQAALQTDEDILAILAENIVINTRNCKYFLRQSPELIKTALERNPNAKIWNELLTKAVANGYSSHELYNVNFNIIQDKCQSL